LEKERTEKGLRNTINIIQRVPITPVMQVDKIKNFIIGWLDWEYKIDNLCQEHMSVEEERPTTKESDTEN
jgi:hypothetical protein